MKLTCTNTGINNSCCNSPPLECFSHAIGRATFKYHDVISS